MAKEKIEQGPVCRLNPKEASVLEDIRTARPELKHMKPGTLLHFLLTEKIGHELARLKNAPAQSQTIPLMFNPPEPVAVLQYETQTPTPHPIRQENLRY